MTEETSLELEDGCGEIIFSGSADWLVTLEVLLAGDEVEVLSLSLFFKWVCHTFFISLSVRPGNLAAIADHLKIDGGN